LVTPAFGELCLFEDSPDRQFTIVATTQAEVRVLTEVQLRECFAEHPGAESAMRVSVMSKYNAIAEDHLGTVRSRVSHMTARSTHRSTHGSTHFSWMLCLLFSVMYMIGAVALEKVLKPAGNDTDTPWLAWYYVGCMVGYLLSGYIFLRRFCVRCQMHAVLGSILVYQLVVALVINAAVGIAFPDGYDPLEVAAGNTMAILMFLGAPMLDMTASTQVESLVTFAGGVLGICYTLYMSLFYWRTGMVVQPGRQFQNVTGLQLGMTGEWTKLDIRRNCLSICLMLLLSSIKDALKDRDHKRLYFVKVCREQRDTQAAIEAGTLPEERTRSHWAMKTIWLVLSSTLLVFVGYARSRTDSELGDWFIIYLWIVFVVGCLMSVIYFWELGVPGRVPDLLSSLLAWQVILLISAGAMLSMLMPDPGKERQSVPIYLAVTLASFTPLLLDVCKSTKFESRVSLSIWTLCILYFVTGSVWLWPDMPLFQGFKHEDTGTYYCAYTKNEARRSCFLNALFLVMASLKDSWYDRHHKHMLFVRDARLKPSYIRAKWRQAVRKMTAVKGLGRYGSLGTKRIDGLGRSVTTTSLRFEAHLTVVERRMYFVNFGSKIGVWHVPPGARVQYEGHVYTARKHGSGDGSRIVLVDDANKFRMLNTDTGECESSVSAAAAMRVSVMSVRAAGRVRNIQI
jgi:hypothetical protein